MLDQLLPAGTTIDLTITSPPYGDIVDYGIPNQIGFGQEHAAYLDDMLKIFGSLFDRTSPGGSLWLIVDSIKASSKRGVGRLVPLPFELSQQAEQAGWVLHDMMIWRKDRTLPWSRPGQLPNAFEYILLLVKGPSFTYHLERIRETEGLEEWWRRYPERYSPLGAAPSNVWDFPIPVQGSWSNGLIRHRCPLPKGLIRRIVELCSDPGDLVCDPFAGIGSVPAVAASMDRRFFGIELSASFVEQFYSLVLPEALNENGASGEARAKATQAFGLRISRLRHAKIPRVIGRALRAANIRFVAIESEAFPTVSDDPNDHSVGSQNLTVFVQEDDRAKCESLAAGLLSRPPLSKFGVKAKLHVAPAEAWNRPRNPKAWSRISLDQRDPSAVTQGLVPSTEDPVVLVNLTLKELTLDA